MRPAKKIWYTILCVCICNLIGISPGFADIYKYIDSNGVLHFTNAPTSSHYRLYIKERPAAALPASLTGKYEPIINAASKRHGISAHLLNAMIKVESDYNPRAVSRKGAKGLMQIMPETMKALNIANGFDPWENIMGGARYFKQLFNRYEGKLPLALAAYNAGPGVVDRFGSIPPFRETEAYVEKVIRYYYLFKRG
ncbi:MAG: transglycosylase SLT domain-containing protein [Desulfobacterales bacterium]|nr:transglycosylase SLT domain-containing protein [Desulfobacterales bacterium]